MVKSIFSLLAFFCSASAMAQFVIKDINDTTDLGTYVFPVLLSQRQPEIARKINQSLQMSELGLAITPSVKDPLARLKNEDEYSYSIVCNNERIFSLEIATGHNGAGSHFQFRNYSFDARTGNAINESTLFSPSALPKVKQALYKAWKESIKAHLNENNHGENYGECLAEAEKMTSLEINRMVVSENAVELWGGNCLDGSMWMIDQTLGPHRLPYEQLLSMLTPQGLSLFVGVPASVSALPQTLIKGKVDGKYPITLTFSPPDPSGSLKGILVYDKFSTPIELSGTLMANKVLFHEMDASHHPVSDIECTWNGKDLNGTFKNRKSGKVMTFIAAKM